MSNEIPEEPQEYPIGRTDPKKPPPKEGLASGLTEEAHQMFLKHLKRFCVQIGK